MPVETIQTPTVLHQQVNQIVRSEEFRNSQILRRLLLYLCEKAVLGEADHLKEYTVAIEGLGKPTTYDPQHKSAVRIQVGRLRQKLADYYRGEGKDDPVIVELPKGRFRLSWEFRDMPELLPRLEVPAIAVSQQLKSPAGSPDWSSVLIPIAVIVLFILVAICGALLIIRTLHPGTADIRAAQGWTPALEDLWSPFLDSKYPLIVSIEDPLFVELRSSPGAYFRDRSLNQWQDVVNSPAVQKLANSLHANNIEPSRYYTAFGEAEASFMLGRLLGNRAPVFSMVKTSQLTWQQLADNNVVFIGVENLFFEQTKGLPIEPKLIPVLDGIRNPQPASGEPAFLRISILPRRQNRALRMLSSPIFPDRWGLTMWRALPATVRPVTSERCSGLLILLLPNC
jgi:hypothetical protein